MIYKEFKPNPSLADYVQLIWIMESENETEKYEKSQIMPDGIVEVIFHYEEPFITHEQNGEKFKQPKGFAVSMMRKYIEIESDGKTGFISIRFFPWGAYHFFKEPIKYFLDQTIDSEKLWKEQNEKMLKKISSTSNHEEKINIVEDFLVEQLKENKQNDKQIDDAVKLIRTSKGQIPIEEIAEKVFLTKRTLERKFLETVGTSPKIFSRITRFLNICHHLEEHRNKTLTQLTYECGYYDQAHFIKDFREFSGFTPKEFFAKQNVFFADI
ncbi:MAG: helix-turn-helix transcriptional regulator [Bacteroidetes bacterium]|nr:helix-turn-helix transcriptional regulator [Bacteroidota bacterium]